LSPAEYGIAHPRYRDFRFCPRCGTAFGPNDFQAADCLFLCRACDFDFYQNPLPSAVIVIPRSGASGDILVVKRRTKPAVGKWCPPGGFVRYDEEPGAAAIREAREEAGVEVEVVHLLRVGLLAYVYRERSVCILEVAFVGRLVGPPPGADSVTQEASAIAFKAVHDLLGDTNTLAFPEQAAVLRAYAAL
jgi:8-oxo-dGTP diphosphatase